jgi:hypothetical protein
MLTSEVLNDAADIIGRNGWATADGWHPKCDSQPVCLEGALRLALGGAIHGTDAHRVLGEYLMGRPGAQINSLTGRVILFAWNDEPGRTADEVIEVLRAAAVIEAARESELAAVSA